jgi:hypothetical protein
MKRMIYSLFAVLILLLSFAAPLAAQRFELVPFAGYETGAKIEAITGGVFNISGGLSYGGSFSIGFKNSYRLELSYNRMQSDLTYTINNDPDPVCDLAVNQISIGFAYEYNPEDRFVPYGKFAIGSVIYEPTSTDTESEKIMHFTIAGGLKYNLSDHIGFRVQADLLLPLFFEGMYFTEGPGGEEPEVGTKISGVMGDFTAGIVFRF